MNIDQLITKYGATVAKQLQIATTQVYEKLLWYVQIHALVELVKIGVTSLCVIIFLCFILPPIIKRNKKWIIETDGFIFVIYIFGLIILMIPIAALYSFIAYITDLITQIILPQYWIIEQIVNKATGN